MDEGAAFGFFPQLRPRRRLQDPIASADVPVQGFRGSLSGLLGLIPDVANFMGRSPMPTETFGEFDYGPTQQLPYGSEYYLKELPLAPTSAVGQLVGQAASFAPLNPAPLVRGVSRGVQKLGTMVGEGMAERVATGRPMLPSLLAEPQAAMFAVEPNVPRMNLLDTPPETMTSLLEVKPQAPVSDLGFYSAAEQAALNLQRNKGSGQAFLNDLLKAENVKKDELQWMGVDDFLKEKPNVTKQEVQDFIANNRVDVQEVQLGSQGQNPYPYRSADEWQSAINRAERSRDFDEAERLTSAWEAYEGLGSQTKYQKYTLPGGENYREMLLILPNQWDKPRAAQVANEARIKELRQEMYGTSGTDEIRSEISRLRNENTDLQKQINDAPIYKSSHFDQPNILAHIRVNDRVDADGKKMLLIEEIQSDWHQAGREKGYQNKDGKYGEKVSPEEYKRGIDLQNQQRNQPQPLTPSEQAELDDIMGRHMASIPGARVPDAPFKDTWYQLALKRVLKHAADNGYERVGLTTGKQQAERFDLSKQISKVMWDKETGRLTAYDKNVTGRRSDGRTVIDESGVTESKLSDYIGKEAAQKLIKESPDEEGVRFLSGLDLQVGGEGMKKYYDEIYPKFLDKYGKKWNARVGETQISTGDNAWNMAEQIKMRGISDAQWRAMSEADKLTLWNEIKKSEGKTQESIRYIDITPEMKGAVSKGQPLFAAAPALPLGAQGLLGEPEKKKELSLLD